MIRYAARSGAIRDVLGDLVLGDQGYVGLKRRLVRAAPRFALESARSAIAGATQWRKWRTPVKTMARLVLVGGGDDLFVLHRAAGLDDGGGPGAARSRRGRRGTGRTRRRPPPCPSGAARAFRAAKRAASTRLICPAPTPTVCTALA